MVIGPISIVMADMRWDTRSGNLLDKRIHGTDQFGARTRCSKGHEYTPENTRVYRRNHWHIRIPWNLHAPTTSHPKGTEGDM